MDKLTPEQRSQQMRRIRSQDTAPELQVRKIVTGLGYRYRLHCADLPGTPDLVLRSRRRAVFVSGCYWHGHHCRAGRNQPRTHRAYWQTKIAGNLARDTRVQRKLRRDGWRVLVIWECQLRKPELVSRRLSRWLATP